VTKAVTKAVMSANLHAGRAVNKAIAACLIAALSSGCATARGPAQLGSSLAGASSETDWSRVRQLAPPAEIFVTVLGSPPRSRHFVTADESSLIALNLGSAALSAEAASTLRDMAANNPARLVALQRGGAHEQGRVRIGRDGVFVDERRIAALDEVLETTARGSVSQIDGPVVERGSVGGSVLGAFLGFSVGVVPALGGASEGVAWLLLAGSVAAGGYLGHHWTRHTTYGLVYRAVQ
jgi:uncharacterized protein YcfJ